MTEIETDQFLEHMKLTQEERKIKSQHYLQKYEDSVPVFISSITKGIEVPQSKLLLKKVYTVSQFIRNIKKSDVNTKESALYLYSKERILKPTDTFDNVYSKFKDNDGFLYIKVSEIPALGSPANQTLL